MTVSFSLLRNWKPHRRKYLRFYSKFLAKFKNPLSSAISWNIAITNEVGVGNLEAARRLFDEMPHRTVVSWNTMVSGYAKWGRHEEALELVSNMHSHCVELNERTFSTGFSVLSRVGSVESGKQIHCLLVKSGFESYELIGSSLLNFYSCCGDIDDACVVFKTLHEKNDLLWSLMLVGYVKCNLIENALDTFMRMPYRDVLCWTTLISGYAQCQEKCLKALEFFHLMRVSGEAEPNEFTFDSVVRACSRLESLLHGKMIHCLLIRVGYEFDGSIAGALVDFYCRCNEVEDAKMIYDKLVNPCLNASNSLIEKFILAGRIEEAEKIFSSTTEWNAVSQNLMIKAYGQNGQVDISRFLFEKMTTRHIVSSNTMISVYCKNNMFGEALKLFEETKVEKNTVTWNSIISGYVQNNQLAEAVKLYVTMRREGIESNRSTFSTLFHGCASTGALLEGKLLHAHVVKTPFESNHFVGTSLVDMYAKCGYIAGSQIAFMNISSPHVPAWTALINGYAHHGLGQDATLLFEQMIDAGIKPNAVTFVGLLLACARSGMVSEGMRYFELMKKYGLIASLEHYACIVDLLGRSGHLRDAEEFITNMPIKADWVIWGTLLSACWQFMDLKVGERIARRIMNLDPKQKSTCVLMSNIYAGLGKWDEVVKVSKKLRSMEVKKDPGCSWIEANNAVHAFCVEDRTHPCSVEIYVALKNLMANVYLNQHEEIKSLPVYSFLLPDSTILVDTDV